MKRRNTQKRNNERTKLFPFVCRWRLSGSLRATKINYNNDIRMFGPTCLPVFCLLFLVFFLFFLFFSFFFFFVLSLAWLSSRRSAPMKDSLEKWPRDRSFDYLRRHQCQIGFVRLCTGVRSISIRQTFFFFFATRWNEKERSISAVQGTTVPQNLHQPSPSLLAEEVDGVRSPSISGGQRDGEGSRAGDRQHARHLLLHARKADRASVGAASLDLHRARHSTNSKASVPPPTRLATTTSRQRSPAINSACFCALSARALWQVIPSSRAVPVLGSPRLVRAQRSVMSTANWAPWNSGRPDATTSMHTSSSALTAIFMSRSFTLVRTMAPALRHTRAKVLSGATALVRNR